MLRAPFADAVEEGVVRSNPTSGVRATIRRTDDLGDTPTKALTRAQLRPLLAEFPDDRRLFFEFLAHTGLRISETIEVRWHTDLDLGHVPRLRVSRQLRSGRPTRPKSKAGVPTIPLSPGMAARLRALEGPPGTLAFTTLTGKQLNRSNLWRDVLRPAATRADVPWVGFHTFRHTCASLLFAAGKNASKSRCGSATPTHASRSEPTSTSWTTRSATPASSTGSRHRPRPPGLPRTSIIVLGSVRLICQSSQGTHPW